MIPDWQEYVKEAEQSYNYMINNYNDMFDGDIIKHFDIRYVSCLVMECADDLEEECGTDIQKTLLPWIRNEHESSRLFEYINWKPFLDNWTFNDVYLGYRKLFTYKNYYFQLGVTFGMYDDVPDCKYCKNRDNVTHFELRLYGWKDENSEMIQTGNNLTTISNDLMPEVDWNDNI